MTYSYLDFAAATPVEPEVSEAMLSLWRDNFANPSSAHTPGRRARAQLEQARQQIASFVSADSTQIVFTGNGTESNNLALFGLALANQARGRHLITSQVEHPSVLNACRTLERQGFEVTYLPVDSQGLVTANQLRQAVRSDTILVSIQLANSETGIIQPIAQLAKVTNSQNIIFHTDACQAANWLDISLTSLGVQALTFNASKIYGPKGVGALVVAKDLDIQPIIYGGNQEEGLRSGTENLPAIVGFAKATEIVDKKRTSDSQRIKHLKDELIRQLARINRVTVNFTTSPQLPNFLSLTVDTAETNLVASLDKLGVAVSSGSACGERHFSQSYVLTALGLNSAVINKTIRLSLGRSTGSEDVTKLVSALRQLS